MTAKAPLTKDDIADFTWMWGMHFILETNKGIFIWEDPDYGGDNTIVPFDGTYNDYCKKHNIAFGRSKGKHYIRDYCVDAVITNAP